MYVCMDVCACTGEFEQLTFVSDEISAEDNEKAEQDEDDNGHHPSNNGMVHTWRTWHGCGGLRRWDGERKRKYVILYSHEREWEAQKEQRRSEKEEGDGGVNIGEMGEEWWKLAVTEEERE